MVNAMHVNIILLIIEKGNAKIVAGIMQTQLALENIKRIAGSGAEVVNNMDYKRLLEDQDFTSPQMAADWMCDATRAIQNLLTENQELRNTANGLKERAEKAKTEAQRWEKTAKNWESSWNHELQLRKLAESRANDIERAMCGMVASYFKVNETAKKILNYSKDNSIPANMKDDLNEAAIMLFRVDEALRKAEHATVVAEQFERRAKAAEDRVRELETTHRTEMCENGYDCVELGKAKIALAKIGAHADKMKEQLEAAIGTIYVLIADCPPETCKEICANHDGVCSKYAAIGQYDYCKGFKWIGEKEEWM